MSLVRFLARLFGWLLTPVVAWAASFMGAALAAWATGGWASSRYQVGVTVASGFVAAAASLLLWLRLLRRSPRLQETLQVAPDATPLVISEDEAE